MSYLEHSLEEYVDILVNRGKDRKQVVTTVASEMLQCLKKLHEKKLIHRDIKPENFRVHNDKVFISDFGTATSYYTKEG